MTKKIFRMCLSEREISKVSEDSIRIVKRNMIDLKIHRPDSVFRQRKI